MTINEIEEHGRHKIDDPHQDRPKVVKEFITFPVLEKSIELQTSLSSKYTEKGYNRAKKNLEAAVKEINQKFDKKIADEEERAKAVEEELDNRINALENKVTFTTPEQWDEMLADIRKPIVA